MSVGSYTFVQGATINHSITVTENGSKIEILGTDTVTAYVRSGGTKVSEDDGVVLTRTGSDIANGVIIVSFNSTDSAKWPEGPCELVVKVNNNYHHGDNWEVIEL